MCALGAAANSYETELCKTCLMLHEEVLIFKQVQHFDWHASNSVASCQKSNSLKRLSSELRKLALAPAGAMMSREAYVQTSTLQEWTGSSPILLLSQP